MRTRFLLPLSIFVLTTLQSAFTQDAGKTLYMQRCFWCHGESGDGEGPSTERMEPRPRDFTQAQFKIRSTAHEQLPTDEDLIRTISEGIPNTPMPGWNTVLSEREIKELVVYLKTFSPRFGGEEQDTLSIPSAPASAERGEEIFEKAKCFRCHGEGFRGEGAITTTINFEWGVPYTARDFTRGWTFKGGHEPEDIYLRITGGLNGTPMGPYRDILSDQERWDLAHYVASLDTEPNETSESFLITLKLIEGDIPTDPDAPEWRLATPVLMPLAGQVILDPPLRWWTPTSGSAHVRGLWNDREVAFLLEWNDPTGPESDRPDSALLQFAADPASKPYLIFGDPDNPVKVWNWRYDSIDEEWTAYGADDVDVAIAGFSTESSWDKGRWRVIFRRARSGEPEFRLGSFVPILVSVRDGSNGETGNMRAISTWIFTNLESPQSSRPWIVALAFLLGAVTVEMWILDRLRS